jgi:hypothetical protein
MQHPVVIQERGKRSCLCLCVCGDSSGSSITTTRLHLRLCRRLCAVWTAVCLIAVGCSIPYGRRRCECSRCHTVSALSSLALCATVIQTTAPASGPRRGPACIHCARRSGVWAPAEGLPRYGVWCVPYSATCLFRSHVFAWECILDRWNPTPSVGLFLTTIACL